MVQTFGFRVLKLEREKKTRPLIDREKTRNNISRIDICTKCVFSILLKGVFFFKV